MSLANKFKQSLLVFFVVWLFALPIFQAQATVPVADAPHAGFTVKKIIIDKVFHGISIALGKVANLSLGLPGSGAARGAVLRTADGGCEITKKGLAAVDAADTFGSITVVVGTAGEVAKLNTKIAILTAVKNCKEVVVKAAGSPATGQQEITVSEVTILRLKNEIGVLEQRIDKLKELRSAVVKEIWKAVAVRILMNAQSRLTMRLVNGLIKKYKIGSVLDYVDAASTFVYTKDYIQKNHKKDADKMIVRSILTNDAFANKVLPLVRDQAKTTLGYAPEDLDIAQPDYYIKLAQAGSGSVDPFLLQTIFDDKAQEAKASGDQAARNEVSASQGFVPVRNCQGVVSQQQDIDNKNIQYSREVYDNEQALWDIQTARLMYPKTVNPEQVAKAQKALDDSRKKLRALPETNRPIVNFCEKIQNPGASIANSINSYLGAHLGAASNVKSENLPFFAVFMESVANSFVNTVIQGQKPNLSILTDAGIRSANIAAQQYLDSAAQGADNEKLKSADLAANADLAIFDIQKTGTEAAEYTFKWSVKAISGAVAVQIFGPGNFKHFSEDLEGSFKANIRAGGVYTLRVYDQDSQSLAAKIFDLALEAPLKEIDLPEPPTLEQSDIDLGKIVDPLKPESPNPRVTRQDLIDECSSNGYPEEYCNDLYPDPGAPPPANPPPAGGGVQGAFIAKPIEPIRGGWKAVSPRGRQ